MNNAERRLDVDLHPTSTISNRRAEPGTLYLPGKPSHRQRVVFIWIREASNGNIAILYGSREDDECWRTCKKRSGELEDSEERLASRNANTNSNIPPMVSTLKTRLRLAI